MDHFFDNPSAFCIAMAFETGGDVDQENSISSSPSDDNVALWSTTKNLIDLNFTAGALYHGGRSVSSAGKV
jgi:hypothetical protein